jgi:hypothetical protein
MKPLSIFVLLSFLSFNEISSPVITFVGSTPADQNVRQSLKISLTEKCDFIKWKLNLNDPVPGQFKLVINYGEAQPNTPGFWGGGHSSTFTGSYIMDKAIFQLNSDDMGAPLYLLMIDENLLHILSPQKKVMIGTGGWSYTLSRSGDGQIYGIHNRFTIEKDTATRVVYQGRTPCQAISKLLEIPMGSDCKKLKWVIVLKKDPVTLLPAGYELKGTIVRHKDSKDSITGIYSVVRGSQTHPEAIVYKLWYEPTNNFIYLMNMDNSIILFLNYGKELFPGDQDFSYTLNRRRE